MIAAWKADHLRVSLFSNLAWDTSLAKVFADVFGVDPESTSQKPSSGEATAAGNWSPGRVEIKQTINRIDCILQPLPPNSPEMPLLLDIGVLLPQFSSLLGKWAMGQQQEVVRIALGCGALLEAEDVRSSYLKLRELVRVIDVDVERFRDMQFQVNLPIQSRVFPELILNRLTRWSAVKVQAGLITGGATQPFLARQFSVCAIDFSTDGDRTIPLPNMEIGPLLEELSVEAVEILDGGLE